MKVLCGFVFTLLFEVTYKKIIFYEKSIRKSFSIPEY
jgi:hypothetical protein